MKVFSSVSFWISLLAAPLAARAQPYQFAPNPEKSDPHEIPGCTSEATESEITLGFSFGLPKRGQEYNDNMDEFLDIFIGLYNQLSAEHCTTKKFSRVTTGNRRLNGPCGPNGSLQECAVHTSDHVNRYSNPFNWRRQLRQRILQSAATRAPPVDEVCLCATDPSTTASMYAPPTMDEFLERFNNAAKNLGFLPLVSIKEVN